MANVSLMVLKTVFISASTQLSLVCHVKALFTWKHVSLKTQISIWFGITHTDVTGYKPLPLPCILRPPLIIPTNTSSSDLITASNDQPAVFPLTSTWQPQTIAKSNAVLVDPS